MENGTLPATQNASGDIPIAWVDRLFLRLAALYGKHWLEMWTDVPIADVKDAWQEALRHKTAQSIGAALRHCALHNKFPPTAPEFAALCRDLTERDRTPMLPEPRRHDIPAGLIDACAAIGSGARRNPKAWATRILTEAQMGTYRYAYGIALAKQALGQGEDHE